MLSRCNCRLISTLRSRTALLHQTCRGFDTHAFTQRITSSQQSRYLLGSALIAVPGFGIYYVIRNRESSKRLNEVLPMCGLFTTLMVSGVFVLCYGTKTASKIVGFEQFIYGNLAPQTQRRIIAAMKKPPQILDSMFRKEVIIPSRESNVDSLYGNIVSKIGGDVCLTINGMKETGKTQLAMQTARKLRENGYPTLYTQLGKGNQDNFISDTVYAMDLRDVVVNAAAAGFTLQDVTWANIRQLIWNACASIDGGNVVIIDGVSTESPLLAEIQDMARRLSEGNPNTVVVLVASDATDIFGFKREARRRITTIQPFTDPQIADYLKSAKHLSDSDAEKLVSVIASKYTYSLVEIGDMISCTMRNAIELDFDSVDEYIEKDKLFRIDTIKRLCGNDQTTQKELKEFVASKGGAGFMASEFENIFGALDDKTSVGYKLLSWNWLFYIAEESVLVFHTPIVRDACSQII